MKQLTVATLRTIVDACVGTDGSTTRVDDSVLDTTWDELGLDSLAVYEVVTRLQDELGVRISDDDIDTFGTPRLMIDSINGRLVELANP
ncbi:acyl carrier protein [Microbispora bryophytorum]|uniref:acyl carrier protein n=1 Tax=Microbispora bryophytorum TaxID=1460882 RepID=UPI0033E83B39